MAVKYGEFTFGKSPPRPTAAGYKTRSGPSTPMAYAKGGSVKLHSGVSNDSGHSGPNAKVRDNVVQKRGGIGDGPVKYMAKGGAVDTYRNKGVSNDKAHSGPNAKVRDDKVVRTKGIGDGDLKRSNLAKVKGSRGEKLDTGGKNDKVVKKAAGGIAKNPGSFKRTPPGQSATNAKAAKSNFDGAGRNTQPKTAQVGDVERDSEASKYKKGGRIANLGKYAHGGKVYEKAAGTPKTSGDGSKGEKASGVAKMAMGGLSRGTSKKKSAAIHAKSKKGMGSIMGALSAMGPPPPPGAGMPPPGGAPGMGAPMGGPPPGAPPGGPPGAPPGPPQMASGGGVKHILIHHISHKA